jgi:flagellar hook protein FlgE
LLASAVGFPTDGLGAGEMISSSRFLDTASASDLVSDLYSQSGTSLGMSAGDTVTFAASRGDETLAPVSVNPAGSYGDLIAQINTALGFAASGSVAIGSNGGIVITSDPGTQNAIDGVSLSEVGNGALASAMGFSQTAEASDVRATGSITVFDDLGNTHVVSLTFTRDAVAPNLWAWEAALGNGGSLLAGSTGTATFNPDGTLGSFASSDGSPLTFDPGTGATSPVAVTLDAMGDGPLSGLTQFAAPSEVLLAGQDGNASGVLESVVIDDRGVVNALFTNGTSRSVAQIVLAKFANPAGLLKGRENTFASSANSGVALLVNPGSSAGTLASGVVEMSNVDLAKEFTSLIVAQRGFQANARTISTSDEMLTELVNLKR